MDYFVHHGGVNVISLVVHVSSALFCTEAPDEYVIPASGE